MSKNYTRPEVRKDVAELYNKRYTEAPHLYSSDVGGERTIESILSLCREVFGFIPKGKALDIGSGLGRFSYALTKFGFDVLAFDYSEVAIAQAKTRYPRIKFEVRDGGEPNFGEDRFDFIFSSHFSLFNTNDMDYASNLINRYFKYLNEGGVFILRYYTDLSGIIHPKNEIWMWSIPQIKYLLQKVSGKRYIFSWEGANLKAIIKLGKLGIRYHAKDLFYLLLPLVRLRKSPTGYVILFQK